MTWEVSWDVFAGSYALRDRDGVSRNSGFTAPMRTLSPCSLELETKSNKIHIYIRQV